MTREEWAAAFIEQARPWLAQVAARLPAPGFLQVGFGFATTGANSRHIGEAIRGGGEEEVTDIIIDPRHDTTFDIASTLIHELVHVAAGVKDGHGGEFVRIQKALGLVGKPTQCGLGEQHRTWLAEVVSIIGECPHRKLRVLHKPDGTRMLKLQCREGSLGFCECGGYTLRTTAKWIAVGYPMCPFGSEMTEAPAELRKPRAKAK